MEYITLLGWKSKIGSQLNWLTISDIECEQKWKDKIYFPQDVLISEQGFLLVKTNEGIKEFSKSHFEIYKDTKRQNLSAYETSNISVENSKLN